MQQETTCHSPVPLLKVAPLQQILYVCEHEAAAANSQAEDQLQCQVAAADVCTAQGKVDDICILVISIGHLRKKQLPSPRARRMPPYVRSRPSIFVRNTSLPC